MSASLPTRYVNLKQAAEVFGVSATTVRRWVDAGHVEAVRIGPRLRIPIEALDAAAVPLDAGRRE